jgi:hypothetical protein
MPGFFVSGYSIISSALVSSVAGMGFRNEFAEGHGFDKLKKRARPVGCLKRAADYNASQPSNPRSRE